MDNISLKKLINNLINDAELTSDEKIEILKGWEDKTIESKSDVIMDKFEAENHFKSLAMINQSIKGLGEK